LIGPSHQKKKKNFVEVFISIGRWNAFILAHLSIYGARYLTLRLVLSLNIPQNNEMKICENME
jgi:hypothetical protein